VRALQRSAFASAIGLVGLSLAGCGDDEEAQVNREACIAYRDHLVDLRLDSVELPQGDVVQHRAALVNSLGDGFIRDCLSLTTQQVKCGRAATDLQVATACATQN